MRVAARASVLTPVVHAVEDGGSVCGARPRSDWRMTSLMPVNCPRCLLEMSAVRYALCSTMESQKLMHVREIGEHGFKPRDGIDTRTLCGRIVLWDVLPLRSGAAPDDACAGCRAALRRRSL